MKVVFILGSGHCGSTLLDLILDSNTDIVGIGELTSLHTTKNITDDFWPKVFQELPVERTDIYRSKWDRFCNREKYRYTHSGEKVDQEVYIQYHEDLYREILKVGDCNLVVDSSKNVDKVQMLAGSKEIEPYIVHMSRSWGAVFWSYYKKYPQKPVFSFFKRPLANIKVRWLHKRMPQIPYCFISYEDLADAPASTVRRACDFIGVDFQHKMLQFRSVPHYTLGGNRMKHSDRKDIKKDETWKHHMPYLLQLFFKTVEKAECYLRRKK